MWYTICIGLNRIERRMLLGNLEEWAGVIERSASHRITHMFTQREKNMLLEIFDNWLSEDDYDEKGNIKFEPHRVLREKVESLPVCL